MIYFIENFSSRPMQLYIRLALPYNRLSVGLEDLGLDGPTDKNSGIAKGGHGCMSRKF